MAKYVLLDDPSADVFTPSESSSSWSTASNWSLGAPPASGANALIDGAGADDIGGTQSLNDLNLNGFGTSVTNGSLTITNVDTGGLSGSELEADGGSTPFGNQTSVTVDGDSGGAVNFGAFGNLSIFTDLSTSDVGTYTVQSGGKMIVSSDQTSGSTFDFISTGKGGTGTIALSGLPAGTITSNIEGLTSGDTIEVPGGSKGAASASIGPNSLTITTTSGTFTFDNVSYSGNVGGYTIGYDTSTDLVTVTMTPCYARGTRILTTRGAIPVEQLLVGDSVTTAAGAVRPIRWLGHRRLQCSAYADPAFVWPVRIVAGAFSHEVPCRDLWVSPGHSVAIDGCLIQARELINGVTVEQVACHSIEYWHVELDQHDVILAEALPAESYLDTGNRTGFSNGGAFLEAFPDFQPKHWAQTCLPLVLEGEAIHEAKAKLIERAQQLGYAITDDTQLHLFADGQRIEPMRLSDTRIAFTTPSQCAHLELRCRTFIPAHVDAASNDRRALGICVGRLQLDGTDVPLENASIFGRGWHELEEQADGRRWRWSHGSMLLPAGTRLIVIDLYWRGYHWSRPARQKVACAS